MPIESVKCFEFRVLLLFTLYLLQQRKYLLLEKLPLSLPLRIICNNFAANKVKAEKCAGKCNEIFFSLESNFFMLKTYARGLLGSTHLVAWLLFYDITHVYRHGALLYLTTYIHILEAMHLSIWGLHRLGILRSLVCPLLNSFHFSFSCKSTVDYSPIGSEKSLLGNFGELRKRIDYFSFLFLTTLQSILGLA